MSLLDLLLLAMVAASVVTAFIAGFARAAIGFIAVIGGMLFGFWFYGIPAGWLHHYISSATACNLLGFMIVFFGFQLAGGILAKIISKIFKWTGLSWLDRIFGGVFGFVRGALMAVIFVAVLMAFTPKPLPNWMVDSALLPYAIDASDLCAALAPKALKDGFRDSVTEIRKAWDEQVKNAEKRFKREPELKPDPGPEPPPPPPKGKPKSSLKKIEQ